MKMLVAAAVIVIAQSSPSAAQTFTNLLVKCDESVRQGASYVGVCRSADFYIEWITAESIDWLARGGARDEVFGRVAGSGSYPPAGMYAGLDLLRDYDIYEGVFPISGDEKSFCQRGRQITRAADEISGIYKNSQAELSYSLSWWDPPVELDFSDGAPHAVTRCFVATSYHSVTVDFYQIRSGYSGPDLAENRAIIDALLINFSY